MSGPDLYVLTVVFLALKKTGFSPEKNTSKKKKYLFSMQLFSADGKILKKKNLNLLFGHENMKKLPSKVGYFGKIVEFSLLSQNQAKYQIMFGKNSLPHNLYTITFPITFWKWPNDS